MVAAIKNAIERGENLERAKQTLINSGYLKSEVEEATSFFQYGTISRISNSLIKEPEIIMQGPESTAVYRAPSLPQNRPFQEEKRVIPSQSIQIQPILPAPIQPSIKVQTQAPIQIPTQVIRTTNISTIIIISLIVILVSIIFLLIFYGNQIMTSIFKFVGVVHEEAFLALR